MPLSAFVYVIESPSPSDLLDGRAEGQSLCSLLSLAGIPFRYALAVNRATLTRALGPMLDDAIAYFGVNPIVHFSLHGNKHCVGLTSGEEVIWGELRALLKPLSEKLKGRYLVAMSSCHGSMGCVLAMHDSDEPTVWGIVGNSEELSWHDSAVGFIAFYHNFFKRDSVEDAVERMKAASGNDNFVFVGGAKAKQSWDAYRAERTEAAKPNTA